MSEIDPPTMPDSEYFAYELRRVSGYVKVKIMGDHGQTRWLSVNPKRWAVIREIMTDAFYDD